MLELGSWHSHASTNGEPSDVDLRAWADDLEQTRAIAYVGLIAAPRDDGTGWMSPKLTAWVTRKTYKGPHVTEPALIVES